jgi:hypothetical protein
MITFEFDYSMSRLMLKEVGALKDKMPKAVDWATLRLTTELQRAIVQRMRTKKAFYPLAKSTIKMKKSSKPLIHHGDLLASIKYQPISGTPGSGKMGYFVGVHRSARGRTGEALANIAEIHEFGTGPYVINVTPKMRGFWFAMFKKKVFKKPLNKKTTQINHPGLPVRSFLRAPYEKWFTGRGWDLRGSLPGKPATERWTTYMQEKLKLAEAARKSTKGNPGEGGAAPAGGGGRMAGVMSYLNAIARQSKGK